MTIKILVTGGTIDGLEYDSMEKAPKNHESLIPALLKQSRVTSKFDVGVLMQKDSKFVTAEDRVLILQKCRSAKENKIVIAHGTMTMPLTAKFLGGGRNSKKP